MARFKIGVMTDSFRLPTRESIRKAAEVGADGFQIYTVKGDVSPEAMDMPARRRFRELCSEHQLEIAALCGDLGGHGFQIASENPAKIERSQKIVDLAVDLGAPAVTTHIGVVPQDSGDAVYREMRETCRELGDYAAARGVRFAIETGPESAALLKSFLDDVGSPGIGVNLDPANLVMVTGDDPVRAVDTLKDYLVHTHAKDGVQFKPCDPALVYGAFAGDKVPGLNMEALFREMPLGQGNVPWDDYLDALERVGYKGFLTIEREVGDQPEKDIREAVAFLRAKG